MSANFSPRQTQPALITFWNWLTAPSAQITAPAQRRQSQVTASLSLSILFVILTGGIFASIAQQENRFSALWAQISIFSSILAYILSRTRYFSMGGFLLVAGFCSVPYLNIIFALMDVRTALFFFIPLGLILGSTLVSSWTLFLILGLNAAAMIFVLPAYGFAFDIHNSANLGIISTLGIVLIILRNFQQKSEQERLAEIQKANQELVEIRENLEKRVEERTEELNRRSTQLEASTLVARSAAMVRDLNELMNSVVTQITERFGYYHTSIFLSDAADKYVILQAASSEGGTQLLKQGLKIEIGRQGVVGYAAHQKRPRIVQDVSTDKSYLYLPELSETRSEVALPLVVRNRVIGVLDIQSEENNAFKFDDIYTLQTMADQVALAIDNATLLENSRATLQQLEALNATSTASIWKTRLKENTRSFTYTPLGIIPAANSSEKEKVISVPLKLRGQPIGVISLKRKANDPNWAEAEREMAERVASQVSLAVENARLLEESQRRAAREQKVSEFSNRFSRSLDVDALLQNAVRELRSLPQVEEVSVFINPEKGTSKAK